MSTMIYLLAIYVFSTLSMVGLIWFVQIVHYPLMALVRPAGSAEYAVANQRLTTWVVGPLMLAEAASNVALSYEPIPKGAATPFWLSTGLLLVIWLSTATFSVPQHSVLARGFSERHHRRLVRTNWIRTVGWTIRGALALIVAYRWIISTSIGE